MNLNPFSMKNYPSVDWDNPWLSYLRNSLKQSCAELFHCLSTSKLVWALLMIQFFEMNSYFLSGIISSDGEMLRSCECIYESNTRVCNLKPPSLRGQRLLVSLHHSCVLGRRYHLSESIASAPFKHRNSDKNKLGVFKKTKWKVCQSFDKELNHLASFDGLW